MSFIQISKQLNPRIFTRLVMEYYTRYITIQILFEKFIPLFIEKRMHFFITF